MIIGGIEYIPYLPGLGLINHSYTNLEQGLSEIIESQDIQDNDDNMYGAGTDCVGFVRRVANYSGNPYKWGIDMSTTFPKDIAESYATSGTTGLNTEARKQDQFGYPTEGKGISHDIVNRVALEPVANELSTFTIANDNPDATAIQKQTIKNARILFLHVVPGDIIYYDTYHIGIVNSVNCEQIQSARTIMDMMSAIEITESYYFGTANYVGKRRHGLKSNQDGEHGSWHYELNETTMRKWEIVRLQTRSN